MTHPKPERLRTLASPGAAGRKQTRTSRPGGPFTESKNPSVSAAYGWAETAELVRVAHIIRIEVHMFEW